MLVNIMLQKVIEVVLTERVSRFIKNSLEATVHFKISQFMTFGSQI